MSEARTTTVSPLALPRRRMLRDTVYEALHDMLVSGGFAAGESLSIDSLAQQLDVSPTPVREALVQLESTGMVDRTALRGYRVAPPLSEGQMADLFDARMLLEVGAAERAVAHAAELLPRLHELQERHVEAAAAVKRAAGEDAEVPPAELRQYFAQDWAFHEAIIQATHNRFVVDMSSRISTHAQRLRQFVDRHHVDVDDAVTEHASVLAAFESGSPEAVAAAMGRHIASVRDRAMTDLSAGP